MPQPFDVWAPSGPYLKPQNLINGPLISKKSSKNQTFETEIYYKNQKQT